MAGAGGRAVAAASWLLMAVAVPWQAAISQELRIEHVVIVSPERAQPRRDATVIIHERRIAAISAGRAARLSRAASSGPASQLDGKGLYLVPGGRCTIS